MFQEIRHLLLRQEVLPQGMCLPQLLDLFSQLSALLLFSSAAASCCRITLVWKYQSISASLPGPTGGKQHGKIQNCDPRGHRQDR